MVQVDIFWSYAIGGSYALAAHRQLAVEEPDGALGILENRYFIVNLLVLAILFAPSGICLIWAFPSWETMHVGDRSMPAWLVTAFAASNITQGILGFWLVARLVQSRRLGLAFLQPLIGYFLMFFILVHGWDGTGYRRFFSESREAFLAWSPDNITRWLGSDVALTLYGMGVFLLPALLGIQGRWLQAGQAPTQGRSGLAGPILLLLAMIFCGGLGAAIVASLCVHGLGWVAGLGAFGIAATLAGRYPIALLRGKLLGS